MGTIIRMNSEKFLKKFLPSLSLETLNNTTEYQYILISQDIKIKDMENKPGNIMSYPRLMPLPAVSSMFLNGDTMYKEAYLNQLQTIDVEALINVIVKAAVQQPTMKIVLLCSKSEEERGNYLKLICEYIESVYDMKTYTWKSFSENPEKAMEIKNPSEIMAKVTKKFERMAEQGVTFEKAQPEDKVRAELEALSDKKLKKLAKKSGLEDVEDMSRKKIIKKLVKKATRNVEDKKKKKSKDV